MFHFGPYLLDLFNNYVIRAKLTEYMLWTPSKVYVEDLIKHKLLYAFQQFPVHLYHYNCPIEKMKEKWMIKKAHANITVSPYRVPNLKYGGQQIPVASCQYNFLMLLPWHTTVIITFPVIWCLGLFSFGWISCLYCGGVYHYIRGECNLNRGSAIQTYYSELHLAR